MLWPRSSLELYGSYASGLGLRNSGLDLLLKAPNRAFPSNRPCKTEAKPGETMQKTGVTHCEMRGNGMKMGC